VERAVEFAEGKEGLVQAKVEIECLRAPVTAFRQMLRGHQRLFKMCHGFSVG
jgi:hypothetical protein